MTGLYERNGIWHVDKVVRGQRLQESTGTSNREEAEQYLIHRLEKLRQEKVYGIRRVRSWREAATRYLMEYKDMPSIGLAAIYLEQLDPYIGDLPLTHVDDESLSPYIKDKLKPSRASTGKVKPGVTPRTVNIALEKVIRILNLCARKWRDEEKRPWLDTVPMINKLDEKRSRRPPYPLSWEEQSLLFSELPDHLRRMALYKVNCGSREQEVVKLRWDWEIPVPELDTSVFLIPSDFGGRDKGSGVKNGEERLVVLNTVAKSVIEGQRGLDPVWVFPYGMPDRNGKATPVHRMNDSAWKKARIRAAKKYQERFLRPAPKGFASIRIHDLKHTFGRRLRAAGVTEEDRRALLGHKNGSITSHYSAAELGKLIDEANKISATDSRGPALTILRRKAG
ncbi:tyrosine-type recombinase/integrase [Pseudomonas aeruginosa]|uniref:tyrosine-type recombinase/integrase n=1 Tax=Pseudomonas aeruginosa TaxID=287 RepID=UPI001CC2034A|nr:MULTISPECIES: tyrosine-type recombinase/integrase [Pseudomonas]MCG3026995.1 tyrosine-type recombinase/integrase [Pseudomonas aeruginosa]MCS8085453.1 tyrosine-type recombinase/integrase [Pseudomonas aeruginosa]MCS8979826.1 tyrosine-type recombinase/integrase [Pseudomonas aeruginosa]MCT0738805.1 tyrosine-type recombinase/integrase [Pseudomonas aeruginosa]MCT0744713.1 tyrosine-type recombinase/integrase [Pseudomonas aeruginosa]